jgi:hypothetical protein
LVALARFVHPVPDHWLGFAAAQRFLTPGRLVCDRIGLALGGRIESVMTVRSFTAAASLPSLPLAVF